MLLDRSWVPGFSHLFVTLFGVFSGSTSLQNWILKLGELGVFSAWTELLRGMPVETLQYFAARRIALRHDWRPGFLSK